MLSFSFKHVCIEAMAVNLPTTEVTSSQIEERLAPLYQRLQIPLGTLERLSGISSRYVWPHDTMPSQVSTEACKRAVKKIGFGRENLGAIVNCSVTRDFFEPATASLIHRNLGLDETAMAVDITNACIGFSNGVLMLAGMIEAGVIKAGLVVTGETIAPMLDSTIKTLLQDTSITREQLLKVLPSFTIGSGSVAYVLAHDSIATKKHHIMGAVTRSATQHNDLCSGNGDYQLSQRDGQMPLMFTDSAKLMASAAKLGGRMFKDFSSAFGWKKEDIHHIFCHQVGRQVNEGFYKEMGLDMEKEFTIYRKYGNMVSAALPSALAIGSEEKNIQPGEKVLLTAFGSGLNSIFFGIVW